MTLSKNHILKYLKTNGPSLSSDVSKHLVLEYGVSDAAARQQVSRVAGDVLKLDLSFPKNAKFLFTRDQSGTGAYWNNLEETLHKTNSIYGLGISALRARGGIMPKAYFAISCGSPIKQKGHVAAGEVLKKLTRANLVKEVYVEGVGDCVYLGIHVNHVQSLFPALKARQCAEDIILRGFKSWLKNLGFVSYNQANIRSLDRILPTVSTTVWDLAAPSYLSPLVSFPTKDGEKKVKPGFVVCDVLLNEIVTENDIKPFLRKLESLKSLKNVGKQLAFFLAYEYSPEAFAKLKSVGVSPGTILTIYDSQTARALRDLVAVLTSVLDTDVVSLENIDLIFNTIGKIEGAAGRLRGALFEFIVAESVRSIGYSNVVMNRICQTPKGSKEADVICVNHQEVRFIEAKAHSIRNRVSLEEIDNWLTKQIPIFRAFALGHTDWKNLKLCFEFWTTGLFSEEAEDRLRKAISEVRMYNIVFKDMNDLSQEIKSTNNKALIKTYRDHFAQ